MSCVVNTYVVYSMTLHSRLVIIHKLRYMQASVHMCLCSKVFRKYIITNVSTAILCYVF